MLNYIKGRWKSFGHALRGAWGMLASGPNAIIMMVAVVVVLAAGLYFNIRAMEWALVSFAITLVIVAEAFNTAIEKLTDMVQPNQDPRAGKVKDLAAGAVLLACIGAAVIGVIVFYDYVVQAMVL